MCFKYIAISNMSSKLQKFKKHTHTQIPIVFITAFLRENILRQNNLKSKANF